MANNYDFKALASNLLAQAIPLMGSWLAGGHIEGREWVATNPTRGDSKTGSFKVNITTGKWSDFAVGGEAEGGDLISLYAYLRGLDQGTAYKELCGGSDAAFSYTKNKDNVRSEAFKELLDPVAVPDAAPEMPTPKGRPAEALYSDPLTGEQLYPVTIYRDYSGKAVYRVVTTRNKKTGAKFPVPTAWSHWVREQEVWDNNTRTYNKTGKILDSVGWHNKDWQKNIPLCGADYLLKRPEAPVLVVEGEKTWAAMIEQLPDFAAVTWRGGVNRVDSTDWSDLRDRNVIVCPDYDLPGLNAALKIAHMLKRQGNDVKICYEPLRDNLHDQGWDLADEPDANRVRDHIRRTAVFIGDVEVLLRSAVTADESDVDASSLESYNALLGTISGDMLESQKQLRCLGYGGDNKCYFICRTRGVVVAMAANQLASLDYLLMLMPLRFWYDLFPSPKGGFDKHKCADTLQRWADSKGYFNPDVIRGAGVWVEVDGLHVLHLGQKLLVGNQLHNINEFVSDYMYEATANLGVSLVVPLSNEESVNLLEICDDLDWDCPVYGKLLAGWAAVAPMCGGLNWRPHIWVTGAAGSGKTTVISKILHKVVGKMSLFVAGDTSAAGIRQRLGCDALPVIFDEFEGENPKRLDELQKTLDLARQASSESGALMLKGSAFGDAVEFKIRSAFAFSSINVNIQHYADASRITVLTLKDPKIKLLSAEAKQIRIEKYTEYEKRILNTLTPEFVNALQIRSFNLLPVIKQNARIFGEAVQKHLSSARLGDQLGILCAGAFSLQSHGVVDVETAVKWVSEQDWSLSTPSSDQKDHDECLAKMLQYILRPQEDKHYVERAVGEMIGVVFSNGLHAIEYDGVLMRYGFKVDVEAGVVYIANSHSKLKEIMNNTPYQTWQRLLLRIEGAEQAGVIRFSQGTISRATAIPKDVIMAGAIEKVEAVF